MKPVLHGTGPQSSVFLLWGCRGLECLPEKVLETFFYNAREGFAWFLRLGWLAKRAVAGLRMSGQASGRPHRYADFGWPVCGVVFRVKHEAYCAGGPRSSCAQSAGTTHQSPPRAGWPSSESLPQNSRLRIEFL